MSAGQAYLPLVLSRALLCFIPWRFSIAFLCRHECERIDLLDDDIHEYDDAAIGRQLRKTSDESLRLETEFDIPSSERARVAGNDEARFVKSVQDFGAVIPRIHLFQVSGTSLELKADIPELLRSRASGPSQSCPFGWLVPSSRRCRRQCDTSRL